MFAWIHTLFKDGEADLKTVVEHIETDFKTLEARVKSLEAAQTAPTAAAPTASAPAGSTTGTAKA